MKLSELYQSAKNRKLKAKNRKEDKMTNFVEKKSIIEVVTDNGESEIFSNCIPLTSDEWLKKLDEMGYETKSIVSIN